MENKRSKRRSLFRGIGGWKGWLFEFLFEPNDSKGARELYRSCFEHEKEKKEQKISPKHYIIHPFSTFRWIWDLFLILVLTFALIVQPLEIAFFSNYVTKLDPDTNKTVTYIKVEGEELWDQLSLVIDIVFSLDILINFRTAYIDPETEKIYYDMKIIAENYIKSWFIVDLLTSVPLADMYQFFAGKGTSSSIHITLSFVKLLKLISLIKILRIFRLVRYIHVLENYLQVKGAYVSLFHLTVVVLMFLHWNACVQYLIPFLQQFPPNTWVDKYPLDLTKKDKFFKYSVAMYRATNSILRSGWGVFTHSEYDNNIELWTNIITYLTGRTFYVLFIVAFKRIDEKSDSEKRKAQLQTEEVKEYMKYKKVPVKLQRRVLDFYGFIEKYLYFNEHDILYKQRMSHPIRHEMLTHNLKAILTKVSFLESSSQAFLEDILCKLKFQAFITGDVIVQAGKRGRALFFIESGVVEFLDTEGNVVEERGSGQHFGEAAILFNRPEQDTVVAQEMCEIYELSKDDFLHALEEHSDLKEDYIARVQLVNCLEERIRSRRNVDKNSDDDAV